MDELILKQINWEEMQEKHLKKPCYGVPTYYAVDNMGNYYVWPLTFKIEVK